MPPPHKKSAKKKQSANWKTLLWIGVVLLAFVISISIFFMVNTSDSNGFNLSGIAGILDNTEQIKSYLSNERTFDNYYKVEHREKIPYKITIHKNHNKFTVIFVRSDGRRPLFK